MLEFPETGECFAVVVNGFTSDCLKKVVLKLGTKQLHFHQKCLIFPLEMVEQKSTANVSEYNGDLKNSLTLGCIFHLIGFLLSFSANQFFKFPALSPWQNNDGSRKIMASQPGPPPNVTPSRNKGLIRPY